jgi:HEAT repeat protein
LIEALKDKDKNVRKHAAEALGKIKDASAVELLIEVLNKDEYEFVLESAIKKGEYQWI